MSKISKYFFIILLLSLLLVTGYRYYDYIIQKNFLLNVNTSCDPKTEGCFVTDCQSGPDCDETPYKKVEIIAHYTPVCLEEHTCENFSCNNLKNCNITYCSPQTIIDGEKCFETDIIK